MKVESVKPPKAPADQGTLHKKMMQLLSNLWVSHAIGSFARLGLADAMAKGAADAHAIAAPLGLDGDRVYRLLRALSTVGVVTEGVRGTFALAPLGRLLCSDAPLSMHTAAALMTEYHADIWRYLDTALKGGVAFETLHGRPLFDWLGDRPDEGARFQRMMLEVHGPETPAIVAAYDFSRFKHVIDVAGGNGSLLSAIVAAHPALQATLYDLPGGIAAARRGDGGPLPGVALAEGNMFDGVPAGGDLYLLRHVLHDYDDAEALMVLANVRRAMPPGARLLVLEKTVPADDTPGPGRWLDLHVMLLVGGRERTEAEYGALLAKADLRIERVLPTAHPAIEIVEAVQATPG
ncbi:MAG: methyltransferase [Alphaproteobacteria bacterium]|nr:methyltransferase [Alphaproteobacteria bacterium]